MKSVPKAIILICVIILILFGLFGATFGKMVGDSRTLSGIMVTGALIVIKLLRFGIISPEKKSNKKFYVSSPRILYSSGRANYIHANTMEKKNQALDMMKEAAQLGSLEAKRFLNKIEGCPVEEVPVSAQVQYASPEIR